MAGKIKKKELIDRLSKADILDAAAEPIERTDSDSSKRTSLSNFIREAEKYIRDQRDVLLIAVKIR